MVIAKQMELVTWIQILDESVCISFCANGFSKGMNLSVLSQAMSKLSGKLNSLSLSLFFLDSVVMQPI